MSQDFGDESFFSRGKPLTIKFEASDNLVTYKEKVCFILKSMAYSDKSEEDIVYLSRFHIGKIFLGSSFSSKIEGKLKRMYAKFPKE